MKIIFIGGVKFSYEILKTILENNWNISVVFSYDDSKKEKISDFISLDELCSKYNLQNIKIDKINAQNNIEIIKKIEPDIILVMGWSQLLNSEIISIPKIGVIGSHPTELPKYRGRAPIPWSILKGLKTSALTFFFIEEGTDNGDILDQRSFKLSSNDDATSVYKKVESVGKEMIQDNLTKLQNGNYTRKKQDVSNFIENWEKRGPQDGIIDWSRNSQEIHTLIRATTHPYPGAYTIFNGSKLIIWGAEFSNEQSKGIGKIMRVNNFNVKIGTGKGVIILKRISFNDNKEVPISKIFTKDNVDSILG
jgi:methionyl-tRNA formyltransferase